MSFDVAPYVRSLRTAIARYRPSAVIAEYLWMAPCLDVVPEGTLRVIDTHDVMHVRDAMYRDQSHGAWVVCTEDEEAALLTHADVILAIQEHERATFARMLPSKRIVYIPHVVTAPAAATRTGRRPVVGFVGSAIQGNVVGLRAFLDHAWPVVRARCPAAELHVYGDVVRGLERDVAGVRSVGFVSDASEVYRQAAVMINPVTLGTGLKIKTVEALGHGSALVTTSCGAAGLEDGAPHAFLLENDMPSFGDAVATLLADPVRRAELGRAGRAFALEQFGQDAVARRLRMLLDPEGSARAPDSVDTRAASRRSWSSGGEGTS
jgi:succinoglycan biosynthesis protein ExoO